MRKSCEIQKVLMNYTTDPTGYRHAKSDEWGYGLKFWPGSLETLAENMTYLASFLPPK